MYTHHLNKMCGIVTYDRFEDSAVFKQTAEPAPLKQTGEKLSPFRCVERAVERLANGLAGVDFSHTRLVGRTGDTISEYFDQHGDSVDLSSPPSDFAAYEKWVAAVRHGDRVLTSLRFRAFEIRMVAHRDLNAPINEFAERYLNPAMDRMAEHITDLSRGCPGCTLVTAGLELPSGVARAAAITAGNRIPLRLVMQYDISLDSFLTRFDLLFGVRAKRQ